MRARGSTRRSAHKVAHRRTSQCVAAGPPPAIVIRRARLCQEARLMVIQERVAGAVARPAGAPCEWQGSGQVQVRPACRAVSAYAERAVRV